MYLRAAIQAIFGAVCKPLSSVLSLDLPGRPQYYENCDMTRSPKAAIIPYFVCIIPKEEIMVTVITGYVIQSFRRREFHTSLTPEPQHSTGKMPRWTALAFIKLLGPKI